MFYQHLTAATAAIVMTTATFVGINAYAGAVVQDGRIVASLQTAAAAQIDTQLQVALQQSQREVQDNIVSRSEEHTSGTPVTNAHLVCRLLLEKKKYTIS